MSAPDAVLLEADHAIGWIRINRPERLNAFSGTMRDRIHDGLVEFESDPAIRCLIITGAGRAFSTGGDIRVMAELAASGDETRFEGIVRAGARVVSRIATMSKPVIAAVNGPAAGAGACLALACDLRVACDTASLSFPFIRVGLHPDWGGSWMLPRLIGLPLAAELVFTGGMMNAERCERLGLFNRVVPAKELETAVRSLAGQITAMPGEIVADAKRNLRAGLEADLPVLLEAEVDAQLRAFRSPEFSEGINAFLEKRAPRFGHPGHGTGNR